ncbi:MAG: hypothetical protein JO202_11500 [Ktedonobacteraceae bacterium]|nr:hypothetical protein [Ktedonobacteraceae bacterium]
MNAKTQFSLLGTIGYRLRQVYQQLGFVLALSTDDWAEVRRWLPSSALPLFQTMSDADQQHSLRVCRELQARGCTEVDMLAAALLHDVGKAKGRVPFWTRPVIVLGKLYAPRLLSRVAVSSYARDGKLPPWRRALSYAWWHAEVGADLASAAGLSEQAVLYIRTHHQPHGPAAALHAVDEVL